MKKKGIISYKNNYQFIYEIYDNKVVWFTSQGFFVGVCQTDFLSCMILLDGYLDNIAGRI